MTTYNASEKKSSKQACRAFLVAILWLPLICTAHDVLIVRNVNLRVGPSTQTEVIKLLKAGDQARLLNIEKQNNYYRVLHNAGVGWVWSRNVKLYPEYLRKQWKHWSDADGDCQDTRQEVLIEESEIAVIFTDSRECRVASGEWTDPYSGEVFTDPGDLDVDHMVPLRNAQRSGGWEWTKQRREEYANDLENPEHLIARAGQVDATERGLSLRVCYRLASNQAAVGVGDVGGGSQSGGSYQHKRY